MKTIKMLAAAVLGSVVLSSCGGAMMGDQQGATIDNTGAVAGSTMGVLGDILGGLLGGGATSQSSIVGTWTYTEPAVQFESENLLAKAGGAMASRTVVSKIEPYFQKMGIVRGKFAITFKQDNTCTYTLNGNTYNGTYTLDTQKGMIQIQGAMLSFPASYITISGNQMAMTFDSSKLLTMAQGIGAAAGNSQLSSLSSVLNMFNGMKTGFKFTK